MSKTDSSTSLPPKNSVSPLQSPRGRSRGSRSKDRLAPASGGVQSCYNVIPSLTYDSKLTLSDDIGERFSNNFIILPLISPFLFQSHWC